MSDIESKVTSTLLGQETQSTSPFASALTAPCLESAPNVNSELTVLFPVVVSDPTNKTIPTMGGSIVKLSFGNSGIDSTDKKYQAYTAGILSKESKLFGTDNISALAIQNTSAVRVAISRLYTEAIFSDVSLDVIPSIYLSSSISSFDSYDSDKDYFGILRKNAKFAFVPIEVIKKTLADISANTTLAAWTGISGKKFSELYDVSNDESIVSLMMETIPFINLSEDDMMNESSNPPLAGYFTIIDKNIYLKMPDFSGFDSAGYGSNYFETSELNFLFQIIQTQDNSASVKNIEIKTQVPIFAEVDSYTDNYDLNVGGDFVVTFTSSIKPNKVYLSPVTDGLLSVKSDVLRGIISSQSSTFLEYTSYPNPFCSIFTGDITDATDSTSSNKLAGSIDFPFSRVSEDKVVGGFAAGFPLSNELLSSARAVGTKSLSSYELVGNLSRQNLILHNGVAVNEPVEKSSGKKSNNQKYFKQQFISNTIGLCENYRPRVFSSPTKFIPSPWIMGSSKVNDNGDGTFTVKWSKSDLLNFYSSDTTSMKLVVYAWDGECQIAKMSNGYLEVAKESPLIDQINPDGSQSGGKIVTCTPVGEQNTNIIVIKTTSAQSITSVIIGTSDPITPTNPTADSISVEVPCGITGLQPVTLISGDLTSDIKQINISDITVIDLNQLPTSITEDAGLSKPQADAFSTTISEIPICYGDPRAKIKLKNKKKAFNKQLYLYVGFADEDIVKLFSTDYIEVTSHSPSIFVAKDWFYALGQNINDDFFKESKTSASLFFPGSNYSSRPLSLLADIGKDKSAYFVISGRAPADFVTTDNFGIITLGDGTKPAFVPSPLIIGMAAKYTDGSTAINLGNFGSNTSYNKIVNKIMNDEFGITSLQQGTSVVIKDKFKKLVILFRYRDLIKFKKKNFKLYIKDAKVGNSFLLDGIKRVSSLDTGESETLTSDLYYLVAKNMSVSSSTDANVRIDIYDPDFSINSSTQDKVNDFSLTISGLDGLTISTDPNSSSAFVTSEIDVADVFPGYQENKALTGLFADGIDSNFLISFGSHAPVSINSNIAGDLVTSSQANSDPTVRLSKSVDSESTSLLPAGFLKIPSGSEISGNGYLTASDHYLVFLRLSVPDVCKLAALAPEILTLDRSGIVAPGERLIMTVKNILQTFIVEITGIEAKVVRVSTGDDGISEVTVIIPEGITSLVSTDPCIKLYNGNQVLNGGINQFGKGLVGILDRQASGMLNQITNQFDKFKEKLLDHPLKFISNLMNHANIEPAFMKSFCDFSFKLTANLSINLQGFSQLLVPVRVILCIIDVICNILNPFQLPSAIIRLFDCLYDLILLLPQISIPVMFLSLLLHLLDLLECIIVKIFGFITIINLVIDAMVTITSGPPNFRDLLLLEELLLKYVISLEADLELLGPIVQILAIFLELLSLTFRFPCSINPNSLIAPCGIDGFEIGAMVSGMIAEQSGVAPHATYIFKKQYLIPVSQPFTKVASEVAEPPSYSDATEPVRGALALDGTDAVSENIYDLVSFNPNSLRKKSSSFDSTADDITDITTDTVVSLAASYTKRRKTFESSQSVIFKFDGRSWKSAFFPELLDRQVIDETKAFDTPIVLLSKSSPNLDIAGSSSYGNFYSMTDGKAMMGDVVDGAASIIPLTIDIIQDGVSVSRTFDTIPAMLLLDEEFSVYVVNEGGIIFGEYKQLDGTSVTGITEIRATVINRQSSVRDAFDREDEVTGYDPPVDDGEEPTADNRELTKSIFSLPQLYFVDTRVAAEAIQAKCQTASINQLPLDLSGDGGLAEVEIVTVCLQDFLGSITGQTKGIKDSLSLGKIPSRMIAEDVDAAYGTLIECTNNSIDNVCSIVVNPLNSSFLLEQDTDLTPILPDPATLSEDLLSGFESSGPAFTGAREYAGGIGDAVTLTVGTNAQIEIIPRDSYDNLMFFDMSDKIRIDIVSDTTGSASLVLVPTDLNPQNYLSYNQATRSYSTNLAASAAGEVKIKASVCNQPIQALTYSDLVDLSPTDAVGCVPSSVTVAVDNNSVALGALSRINRILTITFIDATATVIVGSSSEDGTIITEPQLFGSGLIN